MRYAFVPLRSNKTNQPGRMSWEGFMVLFLVVIALLFTTAHITVLCAVEQLLQYMYLFMYICVQKYEIIYM